PMAAQIPPAPLVDALVDLSRALGRPVPGEALRAQLVDGLDGRLDWPSLERALAGFGLVARRVPRRASALGVGELPALAALDDGRFARVDVPDDARGLAGEAGWCLCVTPAPAVDRSSGVPQVRSARRWFWSVLWRLRGHYAHVALATLVVNLLSIAISLYVMNVYDRVVPNRTYETLWVLTVGTVLALGFEFAARTLRGWLIDAAGRRADLEISSGLFARLLGMRLDAKPASSGAFVSNLREFESIRDVLTSATLTALVDVPFVLLFVAVIAAIAPQLAIVPVAAIGLVVLAGLLVQGPLARSIRGAMRDGSQRQGLAVEAVEGLETLKVNNASGFALQRWQWLTETVASASMRSRTLSAAVVNFTALVAQAVTVVTVFWGTHLIHANVLSLGGLIAVVILAGRAIAPIGQVAALALRIQQARSAFDALQALIDRPAERDPERSYLALSAARGEIAFGGVDFRHEQAGPELFRGLELRLRAGEKVALLGRTGSGKSTLLRLAAGLYEPTAGMVRLDGIEARQADPAALRSIVALVPQDPRLFLGTLRENLELGRPDGGGEARLLEVLRVLGLDEAVARHPRGLDMPLGEDGAGLSGGQRQLVALARLLLREPRVVLLDEPTSGLDQTTERKVLGALADFCRDRTLVVATHRPAALELVDRIVVLEQGRVVLDGPKAAVLEQLARGLVVAPAASPHPQEASRVAR
ncbi:MAG TPA: type I secretion system permease/ATPase, partial [Burkholderiaceae bacterium]|nr:type I secretion system permease/ATPase [Burkholderiaceae bacterium]